MIKIKKVGRWGVFEEEIPKKLSSALYNHLSYKRDGFEFIPNKSWGYVRFFNRKKKCFPWGLKNKVIPILKEWEKHTGKAFKFETKLKITTKDEKSYYDKIEGLRPYQVNAVNSLISNNGGILAMPTGSGKTRTTIEFLKKVNFDTALVIVTTLDLKNQWEQVLTKNNISIPVVTYQSLRNYKGFKQYDIVIFDEVHHTSCKSLYNIAIKCDNATLIGLSATPYRAYEPETLKIIAAIGEIVYSISLKELIKQNYLCDAEVRIIRKISYPEIEYWDNYNDVIEKAIIHNDERNLKICSFANLEYKKGIVLILVDKICHGKIILSKLNKILSSKNIVFVHGSSKHRKEIFEDVKTGKYDITIASKIYGEGVDIPRLKTLILAGGGKSSVKIIQQVGRLLRIFPGKEKAIIYDFQDNVRYLKKHFEARYEIYKDLFNVKENWES